MGRRAGGIRLYSFSSSASSSWQAELTQGSPAGWTIGGNTCHLRQLPGRLITIIEPSRLTLQVRLLKVPPDRSPRPAIPPAATFSEVRTILNPNERPAVA